MIERLTVKNYKSLENITLELQSLNVFVGPNNAGKSNILDCLEFLYDFVTQGAGAVEGRGGFPLLVWGGDIKRTISIELEGQISTDLELKNYRYTLELAGGPTHFSVTKEMFNVKLDKEEQKLLEFPSVHGYALIWSEAGEPIGSVGKGAPQSFLRAWPGPERWPIPNRFLPR